MDSRDIEATQTTELKLKVDDVYSFRWNADKYKQYPGHDINHCFDGQFIVKERDGELYFLDTYWASKYDGFTHYSDMKYMSVDKATAEGTLEFICNLNDVEEIGEGELRYYADEDVFDLSYQHGCYRYLVKKNGAKRSAEKMKWFLNERIAMAQHEIESRKRNIENDKASLAKIEAGEINIYI